MHHAHKLVYGEKSERWHAYEGKKYCCPNHCGDPLYIRVKDKYFQSRVERDTEWYVLIENEKFRLHPKQKYLLF